MYTCMCTIDNTHSYAVHTCKPYATYTLSICYMAPP